MAVNQRVPNLPPAIAIEVTVIDRDRIMLVMGYPEFTMNCLIQPNAIPTLIQALEKARTEALSRLVNPGRKAGTPPPPVGANGPHDKA